MLQIVSKLNQALLEAKEKIHKIDAITLFLIDFLAIHPFIDANGRVACILADLLAIRENLPAINFHTMKTNDKDTLYRAIEAVQRNQDLSLARALMQPYLAKIVC